MPRIVAFEIDPVIIKTVDGKEHRLLLLAAGYNQLKVRYGVKNLQELLLKDESVGSVILYEAVLDKEGMTEEQFLKVIPHNPAIIAKAVGMLLGASFPDPPKAVEEVTTQTAVN